MALTATFYTLSKKSNSTLRPSGSGTTYSIELCEDVSILRPVIILRGAVLSDYLGSFNYAYIPTFDRYYFVRDCVYNAHDGFFHISLEVDVLATLKTEILATTQFVERSASHYDLDMIDTMYPSKATPQYQSRVVTGYFDATPASGYYIIGLNSAGKTDAQAGTTMSRFGSVQYYILNKTQMDDFVNYLLGIVNYADASLTGIANDLLGMISDPIEFIVSCKFFPKTILNPVTAGLSLQDIKFGKFVAAGIQGYRVPDDFLNPSPVIHSGFTIQLDDHPQKVTRGGWVNSNAQTERYLRFEPFGLIPLDCSKLMGYSYIYCDIATDIVTGQGILSIYASPQPASVPQVLEQMLLLGTYASDILIDVPLNQYRHKGYLQAFEEYIARPTLLGAQNAGGSFMNGLLSSGSPLIGGVSAIQSAGQSQTQMMLGLYDAARTFWGSPKSKGVSGSLLCRMNIVLVSIFHVLVDEYIGEFGKPLCEPYPLATLTGYTKCLGAEFGSSLTSQENEMVKAYLNSGFIIE